MTHARKQLGAWGEKVAATKLEADGYRIVARNWRCEYGEIDLIAEKAGAFAFVEVKTRRGGLPENQITARKAYKLGQLAYFYLGEHDLDDSVFTIDLMAIEIDRAGKLVRCEHVPDVIGERW